MGEPAYRCIRVKGSTGMWRNVYTYREIHILNVCVETLVEYEDQRVWK